MALCNRISILILIIGFTISCSNSQHREAGDGNLYADSLVEVEDSLIEMMTPEDTLTNTEQMLESQGFLEISKEIPSIMIDLKYSTTDNFTHKQLYTDLYRAYLHPIAIEKLRKAQELLAEQKPSYSLLVYDAARPLSVQKEMYDAVRNTKYHLYVANPTRTSLHNYGLAVDLTICEEGVPLDMGTPFDFFGKEAGIYREDEFLRSGVFTEKQVYNRKLLRNAMTGAGFQTIRGEWWHFNACSLSDAQRSYMLIR